MYLAFKAAGVSKSTPIIDSANIIVAKFLTIAITAATPISLTPTTMGALSITTTTIIIIILSIIVTVAVTATAAATAALGKD